MKIQMSNDDKFRVRLFIQRYVNINEDIENLKKKAEEVSRQINEDELLLKEIKKEEDVFMDELHKKYGNFSLQDLNDSIYE